MPTIQEINERANQLLDSWETEFTPLFISVSEIRGIMAGRIFGDDASENAAGATLPTTPYSTKELYISTDASPRSPSAFKVGKRGKPIKSLYFPQGYSQLKQTIDRPPLELRGTLKSAFINTPIANEGNSVQIVVPDSEGGKVDGLQKKYGSIFTMSDEESEEFTQILTELIIEAINKAID